MLEFDLEDFYPNSIAKFDLKPFLFQELVLKEKDFRSQIKTVDWKAFDSKILNIHCSTEAILPAWVFPFIANKANHFDFVYQDSNETEFLISYYASLFAKFDWSPYANQRVLLRGCSKKNIPAPIYTQAAFWLGKVVKKLSYGEACSQVPL
ncbi:MAG: DUF2480 family protein [Flavobacteriales bacterium]